MKKGTFIKIARINNFFVIRFNKISEFVKSINHKYNNISSFNRYLIFFITILFLYLFFLSIPSLYDKGPLQIKLNKLINEEYNINVSLSSKIRYNILPKPHFIIENSKIYTNNLSSPQELGQIKKLKIFINQKNFLKKNIVEVSSVSLNDANFIIDKKKFKYIKKFMNDKFSKKKLSINSSKFFYNDDSGNVISIFPISRLKMVYKEKNSENLLTSEGELFAIPYSLMWKKNFSKELNSTFLKLKKLNLKLKNISKKQESDLIVNNLLSFRSFEIASDIKIDKNNIKIKSSKSTDVKKKNLEKLNFKKIIFDNDLLRNILELKYLYNENLSSSIKIKVEKLKKDKLFNSSIILVNLNNGNINFNNSIFRGQIGNLNLVSSNISKIKGDLIFDGSFIFKINSKNEFYRTFQIAKSRRKKIDNFYFDIEYNLTKDKMNISNLIFEPGKIKSDDEMSDLLLSYNSILKINNWIDFKNFVKKIFVNYYDG